MTKEKQELRIQALHRRDALPAQERARMAKKLVDHADEIVAIMRGTIIAGFWPIKSEIDPRPLMAAMKERGKKLALPAIIDKQTMVFRIFVNTNDLIDMNFGTRGPSSQAPTVTPETILLPLSAFDKQGQRIGYGAGYYDRAIENLFKNGHKPLLIGLGFNCQEVTSIPAESHDIPLTMILTESGLRSF